MLRVLVAPPAHIALGSLQIFRESLAKALEASICAAALLGPKTGMSSECRAARAEGSWKALRT